MPDLASYTPRYVPYPHQQPLLNYLMGGGKRAIAVWHRRSGKDLTCWNVTWAKAQERVGIYYYFYPTYAQAKKAVWYGMDEQGIRFIDYIPPSLIQSTHDTDMRIHFTNGSILQLIGSDNVDSIMSTNPVGCVFSEYALQNPAGWQFVSPILRKNGGWAAFVYTPRGHNHGYNLYKNMRDNPAWFVELLTILDTGLIEPESLKEDIAAGIPEEIILQEYYCSFSVTNEGSYFGQQMDRAQQEGRIRECLYDPHLLVHTAWDIGVRDPTVIWFLQTDGRVVWAIDIFEKAQNDGLPFFARVLQERRYVYGTHLAPHDIEHREFGTGDQIKQAGYDLGIDFTTVPKTAKVAQVQAAHFLIPRMIFDPVRCEHGIDGLRAYERKWDQERRVFSEQPNHNWASHVADAFMVLACGIHLIDSNAQRPQNTIGTFDPRRYESYASFDPREVSDGSLRSQSQEGDGRMESWDAEEFERRQSDRSEAGYRHSAQRSEGNEEEEDRAFQWIGQRQRR